MPRLRMPDGRVYHDVFHVEHRGFYKRGHRDRITQEECIRDTGIGLNGLHGRMVRHGMTPAEAYNMPRVTGDLKRIAKARRDAYLAGVRPQAAEPPPAAEAPLPNGHGEAPAATAPAPAPAAPGQVLVVEVRHVTVDAPRFAELVNAVEGMRELLEELVDRFRP